MEYISLKRSSHDGHIIYLKECKYCKTEYYARKINSNYCSNSCRNLKMMQLRKEKVK